MENTELNKELFSQQIGGKHYCGMKMQPMLYFYLCDLPANIAIAIRYIIRNKENRVQDLDKAKDMILKHHQLCEKYGHTEYSHTRIINITKHTLTFIQENNFSKEIENCIMSILTMILDPYYSNGMKNTVKAIETMQTLFR